MEPCTETTQDAVERPKVRETPDGRMDVPNAAKYTGFEPKTLDNWRGRGYGPRWVKVAGKIFYYRSELDRWIRDGQPA
jgi:hypothetical protein